ncbi:CRISPR-associated protein Cas1 [uncultured Methanomethylovorans sp.]|uniref:CRISPR-associated protein Cas1 n=1 Tax=uncultured Methanomethylovorans sp. TaxID=183759 RepID=UPI002AA8E028|nr:CRISPR-associated protein Cas1 [uncultured Methanomethylovorans sp.]
MNKKLPYQKNSVVWNYALLLKTRELVQYLVEKRQVIDFNRPEFTIDKQDSDDIRQKILSISYTDWKTMGFSKGTLHYMKQNAKAEKPFTLNAHVREKLEMREGC